MQDIAHNKTADDMITSTTMLIMIKSCAAA